MTILLGLFASLVPSQADADAVNINGPTSLLTEAYVFPVLLADRSDLPIHIGSRRAASFIPV